MKKKLLSLTMAVAMILSLAIPAFADNWYKADTATDQTTTNLNIQAKTYIPTVSLKFPKIDSDPVVLNPYKIQYKASILATNQINGHDVSVDYDSEKQVISPIYAIQNETNAKMKYNVSAATTQAGELTLANAPVAISSTPPATKQAFIQFVIAKAATTTNPATAITAAMGELDPYDKAANETLVLTNGTVASPTSSEKFADAATSTSPNYIPFQFNGNMTRNSTSAWKETDKVSTVLTFTFTPVALPDYTASVGSKTIAKLESAISSPISYNLPLTKSDLTYDKRDFTALPTHHATGGPDFTMSTAPTWSVVDKGAVQATVGGTADAPTLVISEAAQKDIPMGTNATFKVTLAYKDKNEVPRTVEVSLPIIRNS